MKKEVKTAILTGLMIAVALGAAVPILRSKGVFSVGNAKVYAVEACAEDPESVLRGKTVIFLGSSVTKGSAAFGESFVDYLEKIDGLVCVKEAVSGTTLTDEGTSSYIKRLRALSPDIQADAFICQLSTNDATKKKPLGAVSAGFSQTDFDTSTVAGAMEYIISYAGKTWGCPVIFYTGTKYDSARYGDMVDLLYELRSKWGVGIVDLWNSEKMNAVSPEEYDLYMADGIHPTRAGYKKWWTPEFRAYLSVLFETQNRARKTEE